VAAAIIRDLNGVSQKAFGHGHQFYPSLFKQFSSLAGYLSTSENVPTQAKAPRPEDRFNHLRDAAMDGSMKGIDEDGPVRNATLSPHVKRRNSIAAAHSRGTVRTELQKCSLKSENRSICATSMFHRVRSSAILAAYDQYA